MVKKKEFDPKVQWAKFVGVLMLYLLAELGLCRAKRSPSHILIDEAKYVDYAKLKNETFQTNRGNEMFFGKCPLHHGITITCDMPVTKTGSWFLQYEQLMDPDNICPNIHVALRRAEQLLQK